MQKVTVEFFIVKIRNKYCVFSKEIFLASIEFNTVEEAHLWLIRYAQNQSTPIASVSCYEIEKSYVFVECPRNETGGSND